jgi:hypothetical protein
MTFSLFGTNRSVASFENLGSIQSRLEGKIKTLQGFLARKTVHLFGRE